MGCINPSVVINKEKGIIATFTNLTSIGNNPTPVIKISIEKLNLIEGKQIKTGDRIPTVALYYRNHDNPAATSWKDFDPLVPYCFTDDITSCDNALRRLNKSSWKCLELGLAQIVEKEETGLYPVALEKVLVNSSY